MLKWFEISSFIGLSEQNKDNQIQYIAYKKLVSFVGNKGLVWIHFFNVCLLETFFVYRDCTKIFNLTLTVLK